MTNNEMHELLQHIVMYARYQSDYAIALCSSNKFHIVTQKQEAATQEFIKIKELLNSYVKEKS